MELGLIFLYGLMQGWVVKYTRKEARIMWRGLEAHLDQNPFDHIVPMMGGSTDAIKRFFRSQYSSSWKAGSPIGGRITVT